MLSVRLPDPVQNQLIAHCETYQINRSKFVVQAIEDSLARAKLAQQAANDTDPFWSWIGKGRGDFTTDEWMRATRGDDWNKP